MGSNDILAPVVDAENTETTAEQTPPEKTYTQSEVDAIVGKKIARTKAKVEKQFKREYGELESVLKAGTGKDNVGDITDTFRNFYRDNGMDIPQSAQYSDDDIEVLAAADANDIIHAGMEEVVEEVNRLARIGTSNMTKRERALFNALAEHRQKAERGQVLSQIGVTEDVYESKAFQDFAAQFNPGVDIKTIYDIYAKTQPKKDIRPMGSMKNTDGGDNGVKEFYSFDEASKFTQADFEQNPALFAAVKASMLKWGK